MAAEPGPSEQQYSLRWNDFHSAILSSFRHLRDEEDFVDVTLACDGCSFNAHKVVLSACSPYFRKLLKANPCQHPIVILRDIQQKDMESLLRFMYNGEVHIGQEQLGDFLKAAQMLQVRGLADVPTPGMPINNVEHKLSPSSTSLPWPEPTNNRSRERSRSRKDASGHSPPPPKRTRSSDLYQAQLRNRVESLTNQNHRSPDRLNNGLDLRDSLLGQALEGGPPNHPNNMKMNSDNSLQAQSTGEDSSSDAALSDTEMDLPPRHAPLPKQEPQDYCGDDGGMMGHNGGMMDPQRNSNFPGALLGLQGLLPGPSGMHGTPDNFGHDWTGAANSAHAAPPACTLTPWSQAHMGGDLGKMLGDQSYGKYPAPPSYPGPDSAALHKPKCPECGKVYSNNSNLKQHIVNLHSTPSEIFHCHMCSKGFKTRQYMQIHMLSMHGIRQRKNYDSNSSSPSIS